MWGVHLFPAQTNPLLTSARCGVGPDRGAEGNRRFLAGPRETRGTLRQSASTADAKRRRTTQNDAPSLLQSVSHKRTRRRLTCPRGRPGGRPGGHKGTHKVFPMCSRGRVGHFSTTGCREVEHPSASSPDIVTLMSSLALHPFARATDCPCPTQRPGCGRCDHKTQSTCAAENWGRYAMPTHCQNRATNADTPGSTLVVL